MRKIVFTFLTCLPLLFQAQSTTYPQNLIRFWTFDQQQPEVDHILQQEINLANTTLETGGPVNNYLRKDVNFNTKISPTTPINSNVPIRKLKDEINQQFTLEFIARNRTLKSSTLAGKSIGITDSPAPHFNILLNDYHLKFKSTIDMGNGTIIKPVISFDLNGVGTKSYDYHHDDNWHHYVFTVDASKGTVSLYIDGFLWPGNRKQLWNPMTINTTPTIVLSGVFNLSIVANIDEIAVYDGVLSDLEVYQHYDNAINKGDHYFENSSITAIPPLPTFQTGIDLDEYAVGHPDQYTTSFADQLESYPIPRFKPSHGLQRNANWVDLSYSSRACTGSRLLGTGPNMKKWYFSLDNAKQINTELCENWNYYGFIPHFFRLPSTTQGDFYNYDEDTKYYGGLIKWANENPQYPIQMNTYWGQSKPFLFNNLNLNPHGVTKQDSPGQYPHMKTKRLPSSYYLTDINQNHIPYWEGTWLWKRNPLEDETPAELDGKINHQYLLPVVNRLTRPVDMVSENAEVFGHSISKSDFMKDHSVAVAITAIPNYHNGKYNGAWQQRLDETYLTELLNHSKFDNAAYSIYKVTGSYNSGVDDVGRYPHYSERRNTNSYFNFQHYPTPNFYPRWPHNYYRKGGGGSESVRANLEGRELEIDLGDQLFSPFVAAGWAPNEESNMRPAQWLGQLKNIGMMGADFYYTFHKNNSINIAPEGYAWQMAMPSYAQAISTRYEDLLFNGALMEGNTYGNRHQFDAGAYNRQVFVRKHIAEDKYVISGTLQNNSNIQGTTPLSRDVTIQVDQDELTFEIRRQGSVYVYDKTNPNNISFYQLDGWHQYEHPSYWSEDFLLEAELYNNPIDAFEVTTEHSNTVATDYTNAESYISFDNQMGTLVYNIQPRQTGKYNVWVRARATQGQTSGLTFTLGNKSRELDCIQGGWKWYVVAGLNQPAYFNQYTISPNPTSIAITPDNSYLEIDKVLVSKSLSPAGLNGATPIVCNPPSFGLRMASDQIETELNVFPNPSTGKIQLALDTNDPIHLTITNSLGQQILQNDRVDINRPIDLSNQSSGVYLITVMTSAGDQYSKQIRLLID